MALFCYLAPLARMYTQLFQRIKQVLNLSINSNEKYRQINHWVGGAGGGRNRRLSGNHGTHYNIYTDKNGLHKISAGGLKYFLKEPFPQIFMQY